MPAPETFCDVLEHLNRENARYVIVSGFAVVMHGHKRDIIDLDIVMDPSPAGGPALHARTRVSGIHTQHSASAGNGVGPATI